MAEAEIGPGPFCTLHEAAEQVGQLRMERRCHPVLRPSTPFAVPNCQRIFRSSKTSRAPWRASSSAAESACSHSRGRPAMLVSSSAWVTSVLPARWVNQTMYDQRGVATARSYRQEGVPVTRGLLGTCVGGPGARHRKAARRGQGHEASRSAGSKDAPPNRADRAKINSPQPWPSRSVAQHRVGR